MTKKKSRSKTEVKWEEFVFCENETVCDVSHPQCESCVNKKFEDAIDKLNMFNKIHEGKYVIHFEVTEHFSLLINFRDVRNDRPLLIMKGAYIRDENEIYKWLDRFDDIICYVANLQYEVIQSIKEIF